VPEPVTPAVRFTLGYRPELDGVRAIAITSVMAFHAGYVRSYGGYLGVDVFFVLSGFLITSLLVAEHDTKGGISLSRFYSRRARRLLPALFIMLAAVAIYARIEPWFETIGVNRDVIGAVMYIANWVSVATYGLAHHNILAHTWSLSIEEQFYLVWPLILMLLLRTRLPHWSLIALTGGFFVASCIERAVLLSRVDTVTPRIFFAIDTRGGTLLAGCFLALVVAWGKVPRVLARLAMPILLGGVTALTFAFTSFRYSAAPNGAFSEGITVVAIATVALIFGVIHAPDSWATRVLRFRPIAWIGKVSYGLYLWHLPIDRIVREGGQHTFGLNHWQLQVARILITLAVVVPSFYLIEQPIRHGWRPSFGAARALGHWFSERPALTRNLALSSAAVTIFVLSLGLVHTSRTADAQLAASGVRPTARRITVSPASVRTGGTVTAFGGGCGSSSNNAVGLAIVTAPGGLPVTYGRATPGATGAWHADVKLPPSAGRGTYRLRAECRADSDQFRYPEREFTVE
jgi:peptidoglycan/LPS O-acetylase OafA/YrhL